jgi:Flp pilus assembly secretin CpaC
MRSALFATVILVGPSIASAQAADVSVMMDEVRTMTFKSPVSTVYVGNPSIADINMIDSRHAFILGKAYGSTNIVALNQQGAQISDTRVDVLASARESTVTLNRGAARVTYSCTANHCEVAPQPGDGKDVYTGANGQMGEHQDIAKKAAATQ